MSLFNFVLSYNREVVTFNRKLHIVKQYLYAKMMRKSRVLHQIWPLLFTMRALGWLPVQRNDYDMLYITKKIKIYSAVVISIQFLPAVYITIRGLKLIPTLDASIILFSYVQILCGVAIPETVTIFLFLQSPNHVEFWNKLQWLLIGIEKVSLSQEPFKFGKIRIICMIFFILAALPLILILVIVPITLKVTLTWKLAFYLAFSESRMMFMMGWWIAVTNTICIISQRLIDDYKLLCEYNESGKTGTLVGKVALEMRPLWLQLFHLAHTLGDILSLALIMIMLNCFSFLIYVLYQLIAVQNLTTMIFYLAISSMGFGMIYSFCSCAENVIKKVNSDLIEAIKFTPLLRTSSYVQTQLMSFFIQLYQTSPRVSFSGYIILQKKIVATIISVLITNMLVLYQLHISERSIQLQDVFSFGGGDIL